MACLHGVLPSNHLELIEFETYHIKLNPPFFPVNKTCNGPTTWSILTSDYVWGPVTTYNDFPNTHCTTFGWESRVLTITRSWLLAHTWSGPYIDLLLIRFPLWSERVRWHRVQMRDTALLIKVANPNVELAHVYGGCLTCVIDWGLGIDEWWVELRRLRW